MKKRLKFNQVKVKIELRKKKILERNNLIEEKIKIFEINVSM